jgi:hypothetical protein
MMFTNNKTNSVVLVRKLTIPTNDVYSFINLMCNSSQGSASKLTDISLQLSIFSIKVCIFSYHDLQPGALQSRNWQHLCKR